MPEYDIVMDAIFGFSFEAESIREPFNQIIYDLKKVREERDMKLTP